MLFKLCDRCSCSNLEWNLIPGQDRFSDEGMLPVFVFMSWYSNVFLCSGACGASMSFELVREERIYNRWEAV